MLTIVYSLSPGCVCDTQVPEAESFDNLMNVADLLDERFDSPVDSVTVNGLSSYLAVNRPDFSGDQNLCKASRMMAS